MIGVPKQPADRNPRLRDLADGEDCTVMIPGGACDPRTVVWAHTNTQADEKGMGYKAHDSQGFFACHRCHSIIDQGSLSASDLSFWVNRAQRRTTERLLQIALQSTMRPWKIEAAKWALEHRNVRWRT